MLTALVQVLIARGLREVSVVLRTNVLLVLGVLSLDIADPESGNSNYGKLEREPHTFTRSVGETHTARKADVEAERIGK